VTPPSVVLAIALAAWGPVAPSPEPAAADAERTAPAGPATGEGQPATGEVQPIAETSPAPARPAAIHPALIAKAPVNVRAAPVLVGTPHRPPEKPLYKNWGFWLVSGGIFIATVIVTIIVTRPRPQPYAGNAPPFYVPLP
jgi:hypothetical protein